jgi:hypothetical protein
VHSNGRNKRPVYYIITYGIKCLFALALSIVAGIEEELVVGGRLVIVLLTLILGIRKDLPATVYITHQSPKHPHPLFQIWVFASIWEILSQIFPPGAGRFQHACVRVYVCTCVSDTRIHRCKFLVIASLTIHVHMHNNSYSKEGHVGINSASAASRICSLTTCPCSPSTMKRKSQYTRCMQCR